MKTNSTRKLERRLAEVRENGVPDDIAEHAELMLELVAALSLHDRLTRGHCERVRAYTDMISEEINLPEEDAAKLRWAALLHDVGKIIFSEVAFDDIRACAGAICEDAMEEAEAVNISGSSVSIAGWTLQDHAPGDAPDANGRVIDLSDNMFGMIPKWPTTINPNEYVLFSTFRLAGNVTPWDLIGDDLWLLDADGLIVDYVGWHEQANPAVAIPDQKLGICDNGQAAMSEIAGKPDPANRTTISLATVSDANTAACWEFAASGNASTGVHICPAADTTLTIDHPSAQGQFGMRGSTVHSLYYPNWQ